MNEEGKYEAKVDLPLQHDTCGHVSSTVCLQSIQALRTHEQYSLVYKMGGDCYDLSEENVGV